jgi:hypothetical protein
MSRKLDTGLRIKRVPNRPFEGPIVFDGTVCCARVNDRPLTVGGSSDSTTSYYAMHSSVGRAADSKAAGRGGPTRRHTASRRRLTPSRAKSAARASVLKIGRIADAAADHRGCRAGPSAKARAASSSSPSCPRSQPTRYSSPNAPSQRRITA